MILTGFQLRSAKISLNLEYYKLCDETGISRVTLGRLINTTDDLDEIKCSAQDARKIHEYFMSKNLLFPNKYTISMNYEIEQKSCVDNITRFQFIIARHVLHLSQRDLSNQIPLSHGTFNYFESKENKSYIKSKKIPIKFIISFFNEKNVFFPDNKSVSINKK